MTTISVPISAEQEEFIKNLVKSGKAANKAHAVRYAIQRLSEEEALASIRRGLDDIRAGRVYHGNLEKLLKKFKA